MDTPWYARLFNEERTKARHLSLLNTISRNAIATLNPDEMLAKITEHSPMISAGRVP